MAKSLASDTTSEHDSAILDIWEILDLAGCLTFVGEMPLLTVVAFIYLAFRQ